MTMRMTVREYLLTKIDTTIPRLSSIPALIQGGRFEETGERIVGAGITRPFVGHGRGSAGG